MVSWFGRLWMAGLLAMALGFPPGADAQTPPAAGGAPSAAAAPAEAQMPRYLIYFDEFSAYLSPRAKRIIADIAKKAKTTGTKSITVQARASATGTVQTNKYLAMTRASIVADELEADGIPAVMVQQQPIGQTGSKDPSVFNRRVDVILHR
ncbi:MAG TPA: OmpA family protein [Stellaceae bacterium]|jgi:outer membrane protein OmpA-like peptidoglycan-associated protein|nr:OmpA family protein [Stellaceae bacterium]